MEKREISPPPVPSNQRNASGPTDSVKIKLFAIVLLLLGYCFQAFTPIRLHPDAIILVSMAESAANGTGLLHHGQTTVFPPVYPGLLSFLLRAGVRQAWMIVILNVLFLAIGLRGLYRLLHPALLEARSTAMTFCVLTPLSFVFVKFSAMPLTDVCFFASLMWILYLMHSGRSERNWKRIAVIALMIAVSISTRRIGVALIPALLWMIFRQSYGRVSLVSVPARKLALIAGLTSLCAAAAGLIIYSTSTLRDFVFSLVDPVHSVVWIAGRRAQELGEIAINFPFAALPVSVRALVPIIGIAFAVLILLGLASRRKEFAALDVFLLSYLAVLMVWPYHDVRFWLPILPLVFLYSSLSVQWLFKKISIVVLSESYILAFAVLGLFTLITGIGLVFRPSRLSDQIPEFRSTYCAAGYCSDPRDPQTFNADGLHQLLTFH